MVTNPMVESVKTKKSTKLNKSKQWNISYQAYNFGMWKKPFQPESPNVLDDFLVGGFNPFEKY